LDQEVAGIRRPLAALSIPAKPPFKVALAFDEIVELAIAQH
jgi:hypothetical protein